MNVESLKDTLNNLYLYDFSVFLYSQTFAKYLFSDVKFIKRGFKKRLGREVQLDNPKAFSDKLQWLKLNWYDPFAAKCADKYEVREIIEKKLGKGYLNELYAVYDKVKDIDIDKLPNYFVLKGTHGSSWVIICKNKKEMKWKLEKNLKMRWWLKTNYFWPSREWVYKDLKPRIICEKYLENKNQEGLIDYKFYCFHGEPEYCLLIKESGGKRTKDFYDREWNHMPFTGLHLPGHQYPQAKKPEQKPEKYDDMLKIARKLSKDFPFVRVDLYCTDNKVYFGELTFFPLSGWGTFTPEEWNYKLGELLDLSKVR